MGKNTKYRLDESLNERVKTDVKDEKILSLLSENARMQISAIAKKIRLSKEGTFYRIQRLKKQNVIQGFYPIFDLRDFGYYTYHVFMVINEINPERKEKLLDHLRAHQHTKSIMEYSDRWDIEWVLVARDVQQFDNILTDVTKDFSDIIIEKHKFEIILGYKSIQLPYVHEGHVMLTQGKKMKIDEKHIEVSRVLAEDARLSLYKIAEKVGLSSDAVGYRMKNLVSSGVIRQFSLLPNLSLLGYHWQTMCIDVKTFDLRNEMKFKEYISGKPQIIRVVKTLGDWDLMLHIVTKKVEDFHSIVKDIQKNFVDIITNYQTWGGYKEYYFTCLPEVVGKI